MSYFRTQPGVPTTTMVQFGEWAPDNDRNIAPGRMVMWLNGDPVPLQDAKNVIYTGQAYRPLGPPAESGGPVALPVTPIEAAAFMGPAGSIFVMAGSATSLYYTNDYASAWTPCGSGFTGTDWSFARYGNCIYATNGADPIQAFDVTNAAAGFTDLAAGTAPVAKRLGIIRDFLVAGNIVSGDQVGTNVLQWSALANPAQWDLPNTQAARASQSGAQSLYAEYGDIQYIAQGEEMAMVFQETGITRLQYVGGDVVFSFYTFERKRGLANPKAAVQVGNAVYYLSDDGFYATDGSSVDPIGYAKVNRWFRADCSDISKVRAALDSVNQIVMWAYPTAATASGYRQLCYNIAEKFWTHADYATPLLYQDLPRAATVASYYTPATFDAANKVARFGGTFTDGEIETNSFRFDPNAHALVTSLRVLADGTATAGVAATNADTDAQNFVGFGTPETISREISVRADGYIHAINCKMTAPFTYAQGVGVTYVLRGSR